MNFDEYSSDWMPNESMARWSELALDEPRLTQAPVDYCQFMASTNGGEGFIGENYLILWKLGELSSNNIEYEVEEYAPGLFLFGSNGAGEAFGFDMRDERMTIVMVPFIGMRWKDAINVAETLEALFESLMRGTLYE